MDAAEVSWRAAQFLRSRLERRGIGLASAEEPRGTPGPSWSAPLAQGFDADTYRSCADRILAGYFPVFALGEASLGFPPDWNRDPKSGTRVPLTFGKTLNYRQERLVGDIKYVWEPNRHAQLVTLAQAWHLTREQHYADGCATFLDSWLSACPYPLGVNWTSSMELGLRLVNWSFAWHLLGGDSAVMFAGSQGRSLRMRWLAAVRQHCHFIAGHLSRHSSANNHLLGELLGLFVASSTWPLWRESPDWRAFAQREFEHAALAQNAPDGVNREQAIWYHHEVADMMLIAMLYGRAAGRDFGAEYHARWAAMLEFIVAIMDVAGNVPCIGDGDDAVIARLDPRGKFDAYRSLLASGAVLLTDPLIRAQLAAKARGFDDKSRWLLGDAAARQFASIIPGGRGSGVPRRVFPQGGYYVLGSDFDATNEVRIVADAAPLGYLSIAAHGHADALAFTLSVGGAEILTDSGTYTYHANEEWRSYFRGTRAHNTLAVDGLDQSVAGGNFLWTRHAEVTAVGFASTPVADTLAAEHDGYERLADPVTHRRELCYLKSSRALRVVDRLTCGSRHHVEINWHFAPACKVILIGERVAQVTRGAVLVELSWPAGLRPRLARGEQRPPRGWASRAFDVKEPRTSLVLECEITGNWQVESELRIAAAAELSAASSHAL